MKNRFPHESRTAWRRRFVAIARELERAPASHRQSTALSWGVRASLLMPRSLRGIRLGCAKPA